MREQFNENERIWFTSDTHFDHANIIRFCERPYKDTEEMNEDLIKRWNERVGKDDIVFHLGDFSWSKNWIKILERLNGKIYLVLGNHDPAKWDSNSEKYFAGIVPKATIRIGKRRVILNHEPLATFSGIERGRDSVTYQLYGHVHSKNGYSGFDTERVSRLAASQYDVGVDNNDYAPVSWKEVENIINERITKAQEDV